MAIFIVAHNLNPWRTRRSHSQCLWYGRKGFFTFFDVNELTRPAARCAGAAWDIGSFACDELCMGFCSPLAECFGRTPHKLMPTKVLEFVDWILCRWLLIVSILNLLEYYNARTERSGAG
jgi:hypothetical protein